MTMDIPSLIQNGISINAIDDIEYVHAIMSTKVLFKSAKKKKGLDWTEIMRKLVSMFSPKMRKGFGLSCCSQQRGNSQVCGSHFTYVYGRIHLITMRYQVFGITCT